VLLSGKSGFETFLIFEAKVVRAKPVRTIRRK